MNRNILSRSSTGNFNRREVEATRLVLEILIKMPHEVQVTYIALVSGDRVKVTLCLFLDVVSMGFSTSAEAF